MNKKVILRKEMQKIVKLVALELHSNQQQNVKRKKRIWVRKWILQREKLGASNALYAELSLEDKDFFRRCMRMSTDQFETLLNKVSVLIQKQDTNMRQALSAKIKLEVTLKFLATGESYASLAESFRVPPCTISSFMKNVLDAIYIALEDYIKVPNTKEEWEKIQKDFFECWQFPLCCGAIDGKHVLIQNPPRGASEYFNYKGTYSVVLFAIVDANYRFIYIDVGTNGRMNDSHIFRRSSFYKALQENSLDLPDQAVFVGDDAFPLTNNILKPYSRHEGLSHKQKVFNYRQSRARRVVENGFGIVASRFRIFRRPISVSLNKTDSIIRTACALHNWLRTNDMYMNTPDLMDVEDIDHGTIAQGSWRNTTVNGVEDLTKPLSSNNYSRSAKELRDKYADYFVGPGKVAWQDQMI